MTFADLHPIETTIVFSGDDGKPLIPHPWQCRHCKMRFVYHATRPVRTPGECEYCRSWGQRVSRVFNRLIGIR